MDILIVAFPVTLPSVRVISDLEHLDSIVEEKVCDFNEISLTCNSFMNKYEINHIYVYGQPVEYINGLVRILDITFSKTPIQVIE